MVTCTVNIRSMSLNLINYFLSPNNVWMHTWCRNSTGSEERVQKYLNLQFFKDGDLEMR